MDIRKIKKLIELIEDSNINELEIKESEDSIRISRGNQVAINQASFPPSATIQKPDTRSPVINEKPSSPTNTSVEGHIVRSPMVGTFY